MVWSICMNKTKEAADLLQNHRDELGFVNRVQVREKELVTGSRDGNIVGALLGNHCVQKPQSTIYELAVDPEYRNQGIATDIVNDFADESPHEKVIAKCPVDLPANSFYESTGWNKIDREEGKNRALNVWEYDTNGVILATTGRPDLVSIAERYGWIRGSRVDYIKTHERQGHDVGFIDLHWEDPDHEGLLEAARRHKPEIVVAGDYDGDNIDHINGWADKLRPHANRVVIVPHEPGEVEYVPKWATVGYSTPTAYAGTDAPIWEYRGRDVHILGGTTEQVLQVYAYLADSVVSIDTNSFHRDATSFAKWWGKTTPSWNKLANATAQPQNATRSYENSLLNISYAFRELGII